MSLCIWLLNHRLQSSNDPRVLFLCYADVCTDKRGHFKFNQMYHNMSFYKMSYATKPTADKNKIKR